MRDLYIENFYRCDKPGHHSKICPEHKEVNLGEDILGEGKVIEVHVDGGYKDAEYAQKDGNRGVNCVVQRILCATRQLD